MNSDGETAFPPASPLVKMWADLGSSMAEAALAWTSASSPPDAARQMRAAMLEAWAGYCDQFMRSKEFREAMRQSLDAAVQGRKEMNDLLGRAQHEFQGASRQDVDQLMLSLRHLERRVVDGMDRLSAQVERLAEGVERAGLGNREKKRPADRSRPGKGKRGNES